MTYMQRDINLCSVLFSCISKRTECSVLHEGPEHVKIFKFISCNKETFMFLGESFQYYLTSKYCKLKQRECLLLYNYLPLEVLKSFESTDRYRRNPLKVLMTETDKTVLPCNILIYCKPLSTSWSYT